MSSMAPAPIIEPGQVLFNPNAQGVPQFASLYQVGGTVVGERVESVYCKTLFPLDNLQNSVYAVQLTAPDGKVLYEQPSPIVKLPNDASLEVTFVWARLGNDTAQAAMFVQGSDTNLQSKAWCVMRLPDTVLPPLSSVVLVGYIDDGEDIDADYVVTDIAVTTTRNAGPVSGSAALALTPFLLPTGTG